MPWIEAKYIYIYILLENVKGKYQEWNIDVNSKI
jgi:hypothetical protein